MKKEYINETSWSKIFSYLRTCKNLYTCFEEKCKRFIEAVYWILHTGAQWRELPEKYGKWNSVFSRFNEWAKKNIWSKLFNFCIQDPDLEYIAIDSTIVRAHACSSGYGKQEMSALGRSKGGFTCKIHAKTDALGNPLEFIITPGNRSDITQAHALLGDTKNSYVLADKGYISEKLRTCLLENECIPVIPPKKNTKKPWEYDKYIYKERHVIECLFSKMK